MWPVQWENCKCEYKCYESWRPNNALAVKRNSEMTHCKFMCHCIQLYSSVYPLYTFAFLSKFETNLRRQTNPKKSLAYSKNWSHVVKQRLGVVWQLTFCIHIAHCKTATCQWTVFYALFIRGVYQKYSFHLMEYCSTGFKDDIFVLLGHLRAKPSTCVSSPWRWSDYCQLLDHENTNDSCMSMHN